VGHTRITNSDRGASVIGQGAHPDTGRSLNGRRGKVVDVKDHFGEELVGVRWEGSSEVDYVRQRNVSGTGPSEETLPQHQRRKR
jgi:hypothetical protein